MTAHRVVITGVGPVTALGAGREAFAAGLAEGQSACAPITRCTPVPAGLHVAAEVLDFRVQDYLASEKTYLDRAAEFALAATSLALRAAALEPAAVAGDDTGLVLGSAAGCLETMQLYFKDFLEKGPRLVKPFLFPHTYANTAISLVAIEYGLRGYHNCFAAGWTSSGYALADAFDRVRDGHCTVCLAGGFDALSAPLLAGLAAGGLLTRAATPEAVAAPFSAVSDGCVPGEGAAVFVLEAREHALARGARILAEIAGAGLAAETVGGAPDPAALSAACARAMRAALADAACDAAACGAVLAAAAGHPCLDAAEAVALADVFGAAVPRISAPAALLGALFGATTAVHAAVAVEALCAGSLPAGGLLVNALDPGGSAVSLVLVPGGEVV